VKIDGIGDFVLSTTFLSVFRDKLPTASVTLFCRSAVVELARQQFPEWSIVGIPGRRSTIRDLLLDFKTRKFLGNQSIFDILIDLRTFRDFCEATTCSWIPARQKIAFQNSLSESKRLYRLPGEHRVYDILLPLPTPHDSETAQDIQIHRAMLRWIFPQLSELASSLPCWKFKAKTDLNLERTLESEFHLPKSKPFFLVCPGTSTTLKEYPIPALADAIVAVITRFPMPVVISGSRADMRTTQPLFQLLSHRCEVRNLTGRFTLAQHLSLVALSTVVLSMDTCHAHFAGVLNIPAVVVLGGGHYGWFAPWGDSSSFRWLTHPLPCFGCNWECIHEHPMCIHDISSDTLAKHVIEVILESKQRFLA